MGLSQSYLSQSAYGYDTVSSVDVNGLNGILKKYYANSAAFYYAYKEPFKNSDQLANGIIELIGGNFFDFSGMLSPVLAYAQADYMDTSGKLAITAVMAYNNRVQSCLGCLLHT